MEKQIIPCNEHPELVIKKINGNLTIRGWERPEISVEVREEDLTIDKIDGAIHLSSLNNCSLQVPQGGNLHVQQVAGNAEIKILDGRLSIGEVKGSLMLLNVPETSIDQVYGDLSIRGIKGDLQVNKVNGNAAVREVQGACSVGQIRGNLVLRKIDGEIRAECQGNARIFLPTISAGNYRVRAGGNIHCRIPQKANATVKLESSARSIQIKLPIKKEFLESESSTFVLGGGNANLNLSCAGALVISSITEGEHEFLGDGYDYEGTYGTWPEDFSQRIAERVEAQISTQVESIAQGLNENIARLLKKIGDTGISPEQAERIMQRAFDTGERETHRAQERIRRAQEKLERRLEIFQRHTRFQPYTKDQDFRNSPYEAREHDRGAPTPVSEPVSEQERLTILRMLEQKKINVDEAQTLLAALEGELS